MQDDISHYFWSMTVKFPKGLFDAAQLVRSHGALPGRVETHHSVLRYSTRSPRCVVLNSSLRTLS